MDAEEGRSFSAVIDALGRREGERLPVAEIVYEFAGRGFGAIMLIVAVVNLIPLPPGGTTVTGAPLLLLSLELALGGGLWLPRRLMRSSVSRAAFYKGARRFLPALRLAERVSAPRMQWLVSGLGRRLIGACCVLLSLILVLPVPLGNIAPAWTMILFALAIVQRDGLFAVLGWVGAAISFVLLRLVADTVMEATRLLIERAF